MAVAGQWQVKRYELTLDGSELSAVVRAAADHQLEKMVAPYVPDNADSAAFSVLHRGEHAVWLNVYMWCHEAIIRCVMASAPLDDPIAFAELDEPLIGCVWELPVLCHERSAWVRHMLMAPSDLASYMADRMFEGPVGAP